MQSYCFVTLCAPQHRQRCCTFLVLVSVDHFSTLGRLAAVSGAISLDRQKHRYETPPISITYDLGAIMSGIISQVDFTSDNEYFVLLFCSL